ncbi:MAG TPA: MMPL family transporter [Gammaproteobacteria bacterium]
MSSVTHWIGAALGGWARLALRFRKTVAAGAVVAAALAVLYAAGRLGINTDTADMFADDLPWRRAFIEYRDDFPVRDRNLVIVVDAQSSEAADRFASALVAELHARPDLYRGVFMPGEGEFFDRNGLLYLSVEELQRLSDRLAQAQPLLGLLGERYDGAALLDVAARTLEEDAAGAELAPFYLELAEAFDAASRGAGDPVSWRRLLTGEAEQSARRVILLQPLLDFSRVQPAAEAIAGIRAAARALQAQAETPVRVRLTGDVAMEHEELVTLRQGASFTSIASFVLIGAILFAALRSWRLLAIAIGTLLVGLAFTAALAAAAVGHLNLLSVAFAVLYVGLGSDYIIHITLRAKELRARGAAADDAIVAATREIGASLVICAVTTSAGFFAFMITSFEGVAELGLISGSGVFVSLLAAVGVLPALLGLFGKGGGALARPPWVDARVLEPLVARPRLAVAATATVVIVTFAALPWTSFDSNPVNLRDPSTESVTTLRDLAAGSEAPLLNLVAVAEDRAEAERWAHELAGLPTVREVQTVDSLVPEEQGEKLLLLEDLELILGPGFADLERAAAGPEALRASIEALRAKLAGGTEGGSGTHELGAAIDAFLRALDALPPEDRAGALARLEQDLLGALPQELHRLEAALAARPFGADDLPAPLRERWIAPDGHQLIEIVPRENVARGEAAQRFIASVKDVVPNVTGLPVVYQEASRTIVASFREAFLCAAVALAAILWFSLRSGRDVALVLGPILLAAGATAGLTVYLGMPFNFANIIALPLLVGIGVDSGIHIVHRVRMGAGRRERLFDTSTSHAVLASALTTVASFGNLAFSPHRGTASLGLLLTLGMTMMVAFALIFLPAVLALLERR